MLQSRGGRDGTAAQTQGEHRLARIARAFARYVLTVASRTALFLKRLSHRRAAVQRGAPKNREPLEGRAIYVAT